MHLISHKAHKAEIDSAFVGNLFRIGNVLRLVCKLLLAKLPFNIQEMISATQQLFTWLRCIARKLQGGIHDPKMGIDTAANEPSKVSRK